jgi:hypothetical protein
MKKYIVLVAAVVLAACGTESGSSAKPSDPGDNPPGGVPGGVPTAVLVPGSTSGRVIVRRSDQVSIPVFAGEDMVSCQTTACGTGEFCETVNGAPTCVTHGYAEVFKYVAAVTPSQTTVNVPYGTGLTVEVISFGVDPSDPTQPAPGVIGYQKSPVFTFATSPTGDVITVTDPPGGAFVYSGSKAADPTIPTWPTMYVGIGSPYDRYTVAPLVGAPWAPSNWTLTCGGAAPIAGKATFLAPTSTTAVTCRGTFYLPSTFLLATDLPAAWPRFVTFTDPNSPIATGGVGLPPAPP